MSVNSVSPATLFGGTWTQLKDRFLLGAGSTYTNGDTGGEATHQLTVSEMPSHRHGGYGRNGSSSDDDNVFPYVITNGAINWDTWTSTKATGGDQAHNNMPPYLVVYMWKRVS